MMMKQFNVAFWCTDKFKAYDILPKEKHIVGKLYTQRIEQENFTLSNRLKRLNRKTLDYSKYANMHNKVIGGTIAQLFSAPCIYEVRSLWEKKNVESDRWCANSGPSLRNDNGGQSRPAPL